MVTNPPPIAPWSKDPILVIEDDVGVRTLIETRLRRFGYSTACVDTGAAAIRWLEIDAAALLLLDYSLPDMTGEECISRLHALGIHPPFIVVTGHGSESVAAQMLRLGARDYLVKDGGFLELMPSVVARVGKQIEQERRLAQAEAALRDSEWFHRQTLEAISTGVLEVTPEGEVIYANPEARRHFRLTERELKQLTMQDLLRAAIREDWTACPPRQHPLTQCLATLRPVPPMTLGIREPDGGLHWAIYTAIPIIEPEDGRLRAVTLSIVDITQRRLADEALRQACEDHEQQIHDLHHRRHDQGHTPGESASEGELRAALEIDRQAWTLARELELRRRSLMRQMLTSDVMPRLRGEVDASAAANIAATLDRLEAMCRPEPLAALAGSFCLEAMCDLAEGFAAVGQAPVQFELASALPRLPAEVDRFVLAVLSETLAMLHPRSTRITLRSSNRGQQYRLQLQADLNPDAEVERASYEKRMAPIRSMLEMHGIGLSIRDQAGPPAAWSLTFEIGAASEAAAREAAAREAEAWEMASQDTTV